MTHHDSQNAHLTYRNHPGHAEAIEMTYDPDKTDYRTLTAALARGVSVNATLIISVERHRAVMDAFVPVRSS